ncbi:hypothetical protein SRB5_63560 [Streptomyces sp. RB5]|uniref:HTH tetR-type domain-containing protein n=1 Tax=Streptomyces smaragdinus TaxID=2585196 RepID=A0A7K0CS34_9ACTN|nr:helix-turn-helix domain-containing protein [Streptomyces smaragdinus]MQY16163.1 hypothetical protein [Streptomyces smaragdinus]
MSPRRPAVLRNDGGGQTLRDHLIATAARLIAERGTAGLTVRDIAREARVADGVLYNHFKAKEELLAQALRAHVRAVMETAPPAPTAGEGEIAANLRAYTDSGLTVIARILPAFAGLIGQPKVLALFHADGFPEGGGVFRTALADYLRAEQSLGRVSASASPEAAATMIMGACHELILPGLFQPGPYRAPVIPPGFTERVVTTVLHGIAPRES